MSNINVINLLPLSHSSGDSALVVKIQLIKFIFMLRLIDFKNFLEEHLQKSTKLGLISVEYLNQVIQPKPQKMEFE